MTEIEVLVREYALRCPPITVAELETHLESSPGDYDTVAAQVLDDEIVTGRVANAEADVCETCGANLMVFDLREPVESPEPRPRKRRPAVLAVAAAILVVAGVVVVADRSSDDVATDPTSAVTTPADAIASPRATSLPVTGGDAVADPEPQGRRGCEIPSGWVQVCDAASLDGAVMYAVTAGGPGLVAVGANNLEYYAREDFAEDWDYGYGTGVPAPFGAADAVVWTSPDGLIWSRVLHDESIFGGDGSQQMFDVTVGGPGLVAVGRDGPAVDGEGDAAVWTSRDGLNWSRVPHDESVFGGPGEQRMLSVTAGGPGLVAVGFETPVGLLERHAAVWTSIDGLDWSWVPHDEAVFGGESAQMLSVVAGGPGLVAVGSDGLSTFDNSAQPFDEPSVAAAVWTSVDGLEWSRVTHNEFIFGGPSEQSMASVTVGGPGLVAVGRTSDEQRKPWLGASERFDAAVWTSPDGLIWTRVPHDEAVFARSGEANQNETMLSVVAGGPGLVAVGFDSDDQCGWDSAVWTSPDGFIWSRVPDERGCGSGGPYDRMLSVTVGSSGLVAVGEEHGGDPLAAAVWNG